MMVHRSGYVDCCNGNGKKATFGNGYKPEDHHKLGAILTTGKNFANRIVPQFEPLGSSGFYSIEGKNAFSPFLEFDLTLTDSSGYCFDKGTTYELWFCEDLKDVSEDNNGGTAYTDIYVCSGNN